MSTFTKDPDATLDFKIDWSAWLGSDTISTSAWVVPAGIDQDSAGNDTTTATIWLSGGTVGRSYSIVNRITTAAGRINDRTIVIKVREQ